MRVMNGDWHLAASQHTFSIRIHVVGQEWDMGIQNF